MKKIALFVLATTALAVHAQSVNQTDVIHNYAARAFAKYSESVASAQKLQLAVENLLKNPSEDNLKLARETWTEARLPYSETETYRFYAGPIDSENGPEGFINSWPLDEVYIDSIIERADLYPQINEASLRGANEKDGTRIFQPAITPSSSCFGDGIPSPTARVAVLRAISMLRNHPPPSAARLIYVR